MSFLGLEGRRILVTGLANRKSVACFVARGLVEEGAQVVFSVRDDAAARAAAELFPGAAVHACDLEEEGAAGRLAAAAGGTFHGLLHSVAFARFRGGPFHEARREDFLQASLISAFSLVELARAFKPLFAADASVVTMGISSTTVAAESYGLMGPVKASLEAMVRQLAKSFSADTGVRFNAVCAGPLRTAASAGIPGYMDNYLFAEKLTLRKKGVATREVADAALFLLSPRASGINGAGLVVDAGMGLNWFDQEVVARTVRPGP